MLRRQTVWLLTMLTLMVVLSAYYLFNGPEDPDYATVDEMLNLQPAEPTTALGSDLQDDEWVDMIGSLNEQMGEVEFSIEEAGGQHDFFIAYRMDREQQRAQKIEQYQNQMSRNDATAQTVAEAQARIEAMWDQEEAEFTLENLLKQEGYPEAVIMHTQSGGINVVVQSDSLDKREVLNIIHLVRQHSDVPGNKITVNYR